MTPLARAVFRTLTFFDIQDFPLTIMEIGSNLIKEPGVAPGISIPALNNVLSSELAQVVGEKNSLYFLAGREELVDMRRKRYQISLKRFIKARRYLRVLRFFPYIRGVAISGSQALLSGRQTSDIDLFILTTKNRIWLARVLVSFYFQLIGKRRHGTYVKNRFCLNHYLSEDTPIEEDNNLYTALEYANLMPILGTQSFVKFWQINKWIKDFLHEPLFQTRDAYPGFGFSYLQKIFESLFDFTVASFLNRLFGRYQKRRIKRQEYILVSDQELSFHPRSRGQQILTKFKQNSGIFSPKD